MTWRYKNNVKGPFLQYPREVALARANRQRLRGVVPLELDRRKLAVLVATAVALVLLEGE